MLTGVCFGAQIVHQVVAGTVFMNQRILGFENNRLTSGNTIRYTVAAFFFRDYILGRFSRKIQHITYHNNTLFVDFISLCHFIVHSKMPYPTYLHLLGVYQCFNTLQVCVFVLIIQNIRKL